MSEENIEVENKKESKEKKEVRENKMGLVIVILVVLLVVFGLYLLGRNKNGAGETGGQTAVNWEENKTLIFVGEGCPFCEKLLEEIDSQGISKDNLEVIEVFQNVANQSIYVEAFERCGREFTGEIGVPVVYKDGQCVDGDLDKMLEAVR